MSYIVSIVFIVVSYCIYAFLFAQESNPFLVLICLRNGKRTSQISETSCQLRRPLHDEMDEKIASLVTPISRLNLELLKVRSYLLPPRERLLNSPKPLVPVIQRG